MAMPNKNQFFMVPVIFALETAAADVFTWTAKHPMIIHAVSFIYTVATDGAIATPGVVSIDVDPVGSVGRTEYGTYTAVISSPIGTEGQLVNAAGSSRLGIFVDVGDTVYFERKTAQTATEVGSGLFVAYYELIPDGDV